MTVQNKNIIFRLPVEQHKKFLIYAKKNKKTLSSILRDTIEALIVSQKINKKIK
jgi:predicted DNA-binding protein